MSSPTTKPSILKIDLDGKNSLNIFLKRAWLIKYLGLYINDVQVYDTNHGYHIYLHLENTLEPMEVLLFETILGDDPRRAAMSFLKYKHGVEDIEKIDILFIEKYQVNMFNEISLVSTEKYNPRWTEQIEKVLNEQKSQYVKMKIHSGTARRFSS